MMTKDRHSNDTEVAYHLTWISTNQWRIKEQVEEFGLGAFDLKLFRLEKIEGKAVNFAIVTKAQLEMELPFLLGSATSELNGMYFVSSFCLESCRASERGLTSRALLD